MSRVFVESAPVEAFAMRQMVEGSVERLKQIEVGKHGRQSEASGRFFTEVEVLSQVGAFLTSSPSALVNSKGYRIKATLRHVVYILREW